MADIRVKDLTADTSVVAGDIFPMDSLADGTRGVTAANVKAYVLTTPTITGHPTIESVTATGATGTGKIVFDTSPALTTPDLGTPSAGVLSGCTLYPVATTSRTGATPQATAPATGWNVLAIANGETVRTDKAIGAAAVTLFDDATVAAMVDTLGGASSVGTGGLVRATAPTFTTSAAIGGATDLIAMRYGVIGYKKLIDCNDDASDNAITMLSNSYIVDKIVVANASTSLTTATAGVFPAASGAGTALAADQALSALTGATKYKALTLEAGVGTDINTAATLYFRVGTAQGGAATCSCWIIGWSIA